MASRPWQLGTSLGVFALVLSLGCLQTEGGTGTSTLGNEGVGTDGFDSFDEGFDGGQDSGGLLGECGQYLEACYQDPYCRCFLECAVETENFNDCLARCNLASTPYWAEQFIVCLETEVGQIPDTADTGQDGQFEEG